MSEATENVLRKTWARSIAPVTKIGYMDGASDGQSAVFQESFNIGYKLGLNFGLELGLRAALSSVQLQKSDNISETQDQQKINCQICIKGFKDQENIGNLYNTQKEKNVELLSK